MSNFGNCPMMKLTIEKLQKIVDGQLIAITDRDVLIKDIIIDSRKITAGALFVALAGEKFDGHQFVKQSLNAGALLALVEHPIDSTLPQIVVKSTHRALGLIAEWFRQQSQAKFIALTGSSGKTSVKEMTATILAECGPTLFTQGNFNNDIGVPLTLFRLSEQDKFAVIELGANHIGEISYTTEIVKPHIALINNIAAAHLEGFGSLAGVAQAKGEIFSGLTEKGIAIINLDSFSQNWFELIKDHLLYTFALDNSKADFYAKSINQHEGTHFILHTPNGEIDINLPVMGLHNVTNALAAAALATSAGASLNDIKVGLEKVKAVKGRLYPIRLNENQLILDDSYNANVGSMTAAIHVLADQKGYRVLVVGDMAELGSEAEQLHKKVGQEAKNAKIDCVISVGNNSALISQFSEVGHHFNCKHEVNSYLQQLLKEKQCATVLIKGSRSAKMEEIIENILNNQE